MKQGGYSIFEILIVIAITAILAGGIFSVYNFIAKETAWRHLFAKQESDTSTVINQLIKDIESAGFGIDSNNLTLTTLNDGSVRFPSLAGRAEKWSGCWAELNNGTLKIRSKNFLGQDCQFENDWFIVLEPYTKKNLCPQSSDYLCNDLSGMSGLVFFATKNNDYRYPDSFMVTYSTDSQNLPKECAPGTSNIVKTLGIQGQPGYQGNYPIASCIFPNGFKVRAGIQSGNTITYTDTLSINDITDKNLKLFRLCIIMQVGYRQDTASQQPQFSQQCGGSLSIDTNWWNNIGRWYRWKVIEQDIPLRNYQ